MFLIAVAALMIQAQPTQVQTPTVTIRRTTLDAAAVARVVAGIRDTVRVIGTADVHAIGISNDAISTHRPALSLERAPLELGTPAIVAGTPATRLVTPPAEAEWLGWTALLVALSLISLQLRPITPTQARLRK